MKSWKGCFGAAVIGVVVLAVACLYLAQELTGSKREAAVAQVHELADRYRVVSTPRSSTTAIGKEAVVPNAGDDADARALFIRLAKMWEALQKSNPSGLKACSQLARDRGDASADVFSKAEMLLAQADELIAGARRLSAMAGPYFDLDCTQRPRPNHSAAYALSGLGYLLCDDARVRSRNNNPADPSEDLVAALRLAREVPENPCWYCVLSQHRLSDLVLLAAQDVVTATSVTADQLTSLKAEIPNDAGREIYKRALINEALMRVDDFDAIRQNRRPGVGYRVRWLYFGPLGTPWSNDDETYYAETMARVADAATLPYYQAKPQLDAFDRAHPRPARWGGLGGYRASFNMDNPINSLADQAHYEACLDILRMGLLLQEYRRQYGEYPETLQGIAEHLGGHVPVDPYSGKGYVYVRSDDTFLLYSVGFNGVDDGGVDRRGDEIDSPADDIAWRGKA